MEKKIAEWIDSVTKAGCTVHDFKIITEIRKPNGELLFALLDTRVTSPEGNTLPGIVFIRGHACVIVPQIINTDTGEKRFLMVRQRRIGNGENSLEFPAGMLDNNTHDPSGVAIRELQEETGFAINPDDLFPLSDKMYFSSVGGSDEGIYFFGCIIKVNDTGFRAFQKKTHISTDEGEHIAVEMVTRETAEMEATAMQIPVGFFLFEKYVNKQGQK